MPSRLKQRLQPTPKTKLTAKPEDHGIPKGPIVLCLYAGKDDPTALEATIQALAPWMSPQVYAIDILRDKVRHDVLDPLYSHLYYKALAGGVVAVIGGPNCRTWSICLTRPDWHGEPGQPLRGRSERDTWGLPHLSKEEQQKTDDDSLLLLRMLAIYEAASSTVPQCAFLLEHPADPAYHSELPHGSGCASIWNTKCIKDFQNRHNMVLTTFSQCQLGMDTNKPTTVMTQNMKGIRRLNNWMCTHRHWRDPSVHTKDLSRWAPGLNRAVAAALRDSLPWLKHHIREGRLPDTVQDRVRQ